MWVLYTPQLSVKFHDVNCLKFAKLFGSATPIMAAYASLRLVSPGLWFSGTKTHTMTNQPNPSFSVFTYHFASSHTKYTLKLHLWYEKSVQQCSGALPDWRNPGLHYLDLGIGNEAYPAEILCHLIGQYSICCFPIGISCVDLTAWSSFILLHYSSDICGSLFYSRLLATTTLAGQDEETHSDSFFLLENIFIKIRQYCMQITVKRTTS